MKRLKQNLQQNPDLLNSTQVRSRVRNGAYRWKVLVARHQLSATSGRQWLQDFKRRTFVPTRSSSWSLTEHLRVEKRRRALSCPPVLRRPPVLRLSRSRADSLMGSVIGGRPRSGRLQSRSRSLSKPRLGSMSTSMDGSRNRRRSSRASLASSTGGGNSSMDDKLSMATREEYEQYRRTPSFSAAVSGLLMVKRKAAAIKKRRQMALRRTQSVHLLPTDKFTLLDDLRKYFDPQGYAEKELFKRKRRESASRKGRRKTKHRGTATAVDSEFFLLTSSDPKDPYSSQNLLLRESLKYDHEIRKLVQQFWKLLDVSNGKLYYDKYVEFSIMLQRAILPKEDYTRKVAMKNAEEDWKTDSQGQDHLDQQRFYNALFQAADAWTQTISSDSYCKFLRHVLGAVTRKDKQGDEVELKLKNVPKIRRPESPKPKHGSRPSPTARRPSPANKQQKGSEKSSSPPKYSKRPLAALHSERRDPDKSNGSRGNAKSTGRPGTKPGQPRRESCLAAELRRSPFSAPVFLDQDPAYNPHTKGLNLRWYPSASSPGLGATKLPKSPTAKDGPVSTDPTKKLSNPMATKVPHFATSTRRMHPLLRCLNGKGAEQNTNKSTGISADQDKTLTENPNNESFINEDLLLQLEKASKRKAVQIQWNGGIPYLNGIPMTQSLDVPLVPEYTPLTSIRVADEKTFKEKMLSRVESSSLEIIPAQSNKLLLAEKVENPDVMEFDKMPRYFPKVANKKVNTFNYRSEEKQVSVQLPKSPPFTEDNSVETTLLSGRIGFEESVRSIIHETVNSHNPLPPPQKSLDQSTSLFISMDLTSDSFHGQTEYYDRNAGGRRRAPLDGAFDRSNSQRRIHSSPKLRHHSGASDLNRTVPFSSYANKIKVRRPKSAVPLFSSGPSLGGTGLCKISHQKTESVNKLVEKSLLEEQDKKMMMRLLRNLNVSRKISTTSAGK